MTPTSHTRRLWGIGTARTFRPHWMLAELGLDYETKDIITRTESMDAENFRALSRRGKIPLLEDGDLMIGESAAIVLYLADRYRKDGVFAPEPGTNDRARHDELCFFIMVAKDLSRLGRLRADRPSSVARVVCCGARQSYRLRLRDEEEFHTGRDGGARWSNQVGTSLRLRSEGCPYPAPAPGPRE